MRVTTGVCLISIFFSSFAMKLSGGDFDGLLKKVPASANTLILIDVQQTLASELAKQEGWGRSLNWRTFRGPCSCRLRLPSW
jgi:hypothetical protein